MAPSVQLIHSVRHGSKPVWDRKANRGRQSYLVSNVIPEVAKAAPRLAEALTVGGGGGFPPRGAGQGWAAPRLDRLARSLGGLCAGWLHSAAAGPRRGDDEALS